MTQENMKNPLTAPGFLCPFCGNKGKSVKRITIESLLTDEAKAGLVDMDGFRFCPTPTCQISYFHPETGERFLCRDVRVRIGQKQTQAPRPICYCFNHTIEEIEAEVAETGTSKIPDAIAEKCRQGLDRCEQTNPQGSCCIGDVRRVLREAQAKFGKEKRIQTEANRDSKALADGLTEALKVDIEVQRACVELYRQLATGKPVPLENVASVLAVSVGELKERLEKWAISALEYDEEGRVVAFGGLTLKPTAHRFQLAGQTLYTWCAFDTLFIPRLLNKSAQVESTCPVSGRPIRLSVAPDGIEQCQPDDAYISLLTYPARQLEGNVKSCFCCHVHFFASQDAARTWLSQHEGASVLPVNKASKLAKIVADQLLKLPEEIQDSIADSTQQIDECCGNHRPLEQIKAERKGNVGLWAASVAILSAILSSACCWLPLVLIAFGASAAGVSGFFETYRLYLLGATGLLLAGGFYLVYFRKERCEPGSTCAVPSPKLIRFNKVMLWVATVVILLFALFPNYLGFLIGSDKDNRPVTALTGEGHLFRIEGMTCEGCAVNLQSRLLNAPGIDRAEVSYKDKTARIFFDFGVSLPPDRKIQEVIKQAGYRGYPVSANPAKTGSQGCCPL